MNPQSHLWTVSNKPRLGGLPNFVIDYVVDAYSSLPDWLQSLLPIVFGAIAVIALLYILIKSIFIYYKFLKRGSSAALSKTTRVIGYVFEYSGRASREESVYSGESVHQRNAEKYDVRLRSSELSNIATSGLRFLVAAAEKGGIFSLWMCLSLLYHWLVFIAIDAGFAKLTEVNLEEYQGISGALYYFWFLISFIVALGGMISSFEEDSSP